MNTKQGEKEIDRSSIERIDKLILEGEPLGDEAKLIGAVFDLRKGTKLLQCMTADYIASYTNFRR